jgi:transposase
VGTRGPRRRRWAVKEKRRIVEQTLAAGGSVARVARAHGVNANQVFQWRRRYHRGLLGARNTEAVRLLPVHVTRGPARQAARSRGPAERGSGKRATQPSAVAGAIQVELPQGRIQITGSIDAESLRVVIECLLG